MWQCFYLGSKNGVFYDLTILFLSNLKFSSQLKSSLNSLRSFLWFLLGKSSCQSTIKTLGQSSKVYFHGIFVDVRRIFAQIVSLIVFSLYIQITKIWFIAFSMAFKRFYYFMTEIILHFILGNPRNYFVQEFLMQPCDVYDGYVT